MIIEIRKLAPGAGKALSIVCLLSAGWWFGATTDARGIVSACLAGLLWLLSEAHFGLRITPGQQRLETGTGLFSLFKPKDALTFSQLSGLTIEQRSDKYYRIGLVLYSGAFIELDKKATLDKAREQQRNLEKQLNKCYL